MLTPVRARGASPITKLQFAGLNERDKIDDSEFSDMFNMSSDRFPCLSPRKPRKVIADNFANIQGVIAPRIENHELDSFTGVADGWFWYNGERQSGAVISNAGLKCMVDFNGTICIFPDKVSFDYVAYHRDGSANVEAMEVQTTGSFFFRTTGDVNSVNPRITNTIRTTSSTVFANFNVGDSLQITGFTGTGTNNGAQFNSAIVDSRYASIGEDVPASIVINDITNNGMTLHVDVFNKAGRRMNFAGNSTGSATTGGVQINGITIRVWVPDMEYVCVHNNRLWGLSSGENGEFIYASALGRHKSFNVFAGLASDSWWTQIGTGGRWTGIASYRNSIVAFKDNFLHQIYGSEPFSFQAAKQLNHGCIDHYSIIELGSVLYYLSQKGICQFTGGEPQVISGNLRGDWRNGSSGTDGIKYYISAKRGESAEFIVFDPRFFVWHREDDYNAIGFVRYNDKMYSVSGTTMTMHNANTDELIEWSVTSKRFTEDAFIQKGLNHMWIRYDMEDDCSFDIESSTDGRDFELWRKVENKTGFTTSRTDVSIQMGDSYQFKISGIGGVVIHDIERQVYGGGFNIRG